LRLLDAKTLENDVLDLTDGRADPQVEIFMGA
jgi:hypothetical protein